MNRLSRIKFRSEESEEEKSMPREWPEPPEHIVEVERACDSLFAPHTSASRTPHAEAPCDLFRFDVIDKKRDFVIIHGSDLSRASD